VEARMAGPDSRSTGTRALALLSSVAIMIAAWCGPASIKAHAQSPKQLQTRAEAVARHAKPVPMVTVPAGWFLMGTQAKAVPSLALARPFDDTEVPQRRIWLDAFEIDRDEVSLGNYLDAILKKPRALPPDAYSSFSFVLAIAGSRAGRACLACPLARCPNAVRSGGALGPRHGAAGCRSCADRRLRCRRSWRRSSETRRTAGRPGWTGGTRCAASAPRDDPWG